MDIHIDAKGQKETKQRVEALEERMRKSDFLIQPTKQSIKKKIQPILLKPSTSKGENCLINYNSSGL